MTNTPLYFVLERLEQRVKQRLSGRRAGESLNPDTILTPTEVVLLALDVEDLAHIRIPVAELFGVHTLGEFLGALSKITVNDASDTEDAAPMQDALESIVRHVLSVFTHRTPDAIRASDRLERDLDVHSTAMAKVLGRLEEIACAAFPPATLRSVHTVRDLTDALRSLVDARLAASAPPDPRDSWTTTRHRPDGTR